MTDKNVMEDAKKLLEYAKALGMKEVPAARAKQDCHSRESLPTGQAGWTQGCHPRAGGNPSAKDQALDQLRTDIGDCKRCRLHEGRTQVVFGVGNPDTEIMFIGEAPGRDEDAQGIPFVGRAGQLLNKIIEAMGYNRKEVYIANINKCRPPNNRMPAQDEAAICLPFLLKQVEIIAPKVIVCLGSCAVQNLLQTEEKITQLRGKFRDWHGTPVMPTYHPAFLLRNPAMKKPVWEDMKKVLEHLGRPVPKTKE